MEAQIPSVNFLCYLPLRFPYIILLRYFLCFFTVFPPLAAFGGFLPLVEPGLYKKWI